MVTIIFCDSTIWIVIANNSMKCDFVTKLLLQHVFFYRKPFLPYDSYTRTK